MGASCCKQGFDKRKKIKTTQHQITTVTLTTTTTTTTSTGTEQLEEDDEVQLQVTTTSTDTAFSPILDLPISISHDIFLRLPIKTILLCESVCKAWHGIITDPHFSETYQKYCLITLPLLYFPSISSRDECFVEFSENRNCLIRSLIQLKLPPGGFKYTGPSFFALVGSSCNGLLCFRLSRPVAGNDHSRVDVIYVGNPILGRYVSLPQRSGYTYCRQQVSYQFGYADDKFKVLRIVFRSAGGDQSDYGMEECEIFSVGVDDNWRILPVSFMGFQNLSRVVYLNGVFHWIPEEVVRATFVCTFDLAEEKLGPNVLFPPGVVLERKGMVLGLFNEQLVLVDYSSASEITIWSNADSWTKVVILKTWLPLLQHSDELELVGKLQNGDILFSVIPREYLVSFNIKQKKSSKIESPDLGLYMRNVQTYAPNFSCRADEL